MNETADAAIVGAGIMGCSVAWHLASRGVRVTVLERNGIAAGSTGRSSAIVRQHYSNGLTARMALHSLRVFEEFDERVGGECGFTRTGFVVIVADADRSGLEANISLQRAVGIRTELLGPGELRDLIPALEIDDVAGAAFEPDSGYADPHLTTNAYAAAARRRGATIHPDRPVTGLRFSEGRVIGVETATGPVDSPTVINCAGPWAAAVAGMAGVEVPIASTRSQVAVFHRPPGFEGPHPVVIDFVHGTYFRSETGGLTLVGSVDPSEGDDVVDPDLYPEHADPAFIAAVGEGFARRWSPMANAGSRGGFAGLYAVTPDWHPIVDEVPPGSGCFVCAGFSGHGFKLAPAVGRLTADLVLEEADPPFPAHAFRLARYAEGDPVRGRYAYSITG